MAPLNDTVPGWDMCASEPDANAPSGRKPGKRLTPKSRIVVGQKFLWCPTFAEYGLQLLDNVGTCMPPQWTPNCETRRPAVDETEIRPPSVVGDVHSYPLPDFLDAQTSASPLDGRRVNGLAGFTADDDLTYLPP
ncbi:hypothetical protein M513_04454 [Trichuris suis]|uniref:Uncharacterized protein n=1 Tax=Trichuris suis TaxID=68888 RepID=A0A085MC08_9BILA|nr:hypothetical protein M513_04454 [Trichuris suis]